MKMNSTRLKPVAMAIALFLTTGLTVAGKAVPTTPLLNDTSKTLAEERTGNDPYLRLNEIPWRAGKDFLKRFPDITTDKWLRIKDGYLAKFSLRQYPVKVYYDELGRFISIVLYYEEDQLDPGIKSLVYGRYKDFNIMGITEVATDEGKLYHVNIKNHSQFKILMVKGEMIEVIRDMQNSGTVSDQGN